MKDKRIFKVALMGLREFDKRMLSGVFKLSSSRDRSYVGTELDRWKLPDIMVVDAANEEAMAQFEEEFVDSTGKPKIPTILISKSKPASPHFHHLEVAFPARVLRVLDQITVTEFDFIPELTIGKGDESEPLINMPLIQCMPDTDEDESGDKVLVVDDSAAVRAQVELLVKWLGFQADTADSGESAMEMVKRNEYRAIFLDVVMPGVDGYKVCKEIKKFAPTRLTPVIMLTSKSSTFDRVKGKLAGCDNYLVKPVDREAFEEAAKPYLSRSPPTKAQSE